MGFQWLIFARWALIAFVILAVNFFLLGLPGAIVYEGWRFVLNLLFGREVIADTAPLGPGAWALAIYVALLVPWGLPVGYVLTSWLSRSWIQSLPLPLSSRITWIGLSAIVWSLLIVVILSGYVRDIAKDTPFHNP